MSKTNTSQPTEKQKSDFNLGDVRISQPVNDDQNVIVRFNTPLYLYLHEQREMKQYERLTREDIRLKMTMIFQITNFIGAALSQDDVRVSDAAEWLILLSSIGESFTETLDMVESDFNKYFESAEVKGAEEN